MTIIVYNHEDDTIGVDSAQTWRSAVVATVDKRIVAARCTIALCGNADLVDQFVRAFDLHLDGKPLGKVVGNEHAHGSCAFARAHAVDGIMQPAFRISIGKDGDFDVSRLRETTFDGAGVDFFCAYWKITNTAEALRMTAEHHRDCGLPVRFF